MRRDERMATDCLVVAFFVIPEKTDDTWAGAGLLLSALIGYVLSSPLIAGAQHTAHLVQMFDSTTACAHVSAARGKGGQDGQALGCSRGGFSTKIHLKTDWRGLPVAFDLTPGQASDNRHFPVLLDLGPEITPRAAMGDKGYDNLANRAAARARAICPIIPTKSNARNRPAFFPKALYRGRARIEQCVGKLKRFKRVTLRCEKTAQNYGSLVALALAIIIMRTVHTA